jgi:hypothetical protein
MMYYLVLVQTNFPPRDFALFFRSRTPLFSELDQLALIFRTSATFFRAIFRILAYSTVHTHI